MLRPLPEAAADESANCLSYPSWEIIKKIFVFSPGDQIQGPGSRANDLSTRQDRSYMQVLGFKKSLIDYERRQKQLKQQLKFTRAGV